MRKSVLLIGLNVLTVTLTGQLAQLGTEHGLSNRDITAIVQAQDGTMWIGTADGLNRYDGYTFSDYEWDGMTSTRIKCMFEDRRGLIWLGTWEGLSILDPRSGRTIHHFRSNADSGKVSNNRVNCIAGLSNGRILVTYGDGILCEFTDPESYSVVYRATAPDSPRRRQITAIEPGENATWLVLDYNHVFRLDKEYRPDTSFDCPVETVMTILYDSVKKILYLPDRWGSLFLASADRGTLLQDKLIDSVNTLHRNITALSTHDDNLWIGYENGGLVQVNFSAEKITEHTAEIHPFFSGPPRLIYSDRTGTMWVGGNYGLLRWAPPETMFNQILTQPVTTDHSKKISTRGLAEDVSENIVYIGGYGGLFTYERTTHKLSRLEFTVKGERITHAFYPYRIFDHGEYLWLTSEVRGLYRMNKRTKQLEFPIDTPTARAISSCYALLPEGDDTLWLGTGSGLFVYSRRNNSLQPYSGSGDRFDISGLEVCDLIKTPQGRIWIGTRSSGIFLHEKNKGISTHITATKKGGSLSSVTCLFADGDSVLWVGTRGEGLHRLSFTQREDRRFGERDGLPGDAIASVLRDHNNTLWISTFSGLSKMNRQTGTFENFSVKHGLSDNEFNAASSLVASDGMVFLGGLNGVNYFDPAALEKRAKPEPRIFLTRLITFDGKNGKVTDRSGDLRDVSGFSFPHDNRFCSFSFALDDFSDPGRNTYYYLLQGADTTWQPLGTQNTVRFDRLAPGSYTLRVKGVSSEGMASVNQLTFPLFVSRPFYLTWWFAIVALATTGSSVYLTTRYFYYQKFRIARLRTRLSSDLHDEVGSLLTRISVQAQLMKEGLPAGRTGESAARIASASRQATEAMSDILWSIDARNDRMASLLDKFREHANETLGSMGMEVEFQVEGINPVMEIENARRQDLLLLFKEAVSNVARHSGATKVQISFIHRRGTLLLCVADNGSGAADTGHHTGQGLRNMRMRAERLGGQLSVTSTNGFRIEFSKIGNLA